MYALSLSVRCLLLLPIPLCLARPTLSSAEESREVGSSDGSEASVEGPKLAAYPVRWARRPLVLDEGMIRVDSRVFLGGSFEPGTLSALDLGGAISPTARLELGLSSMRTGSIPAAAGNGLISVLMSPDVQYGDIPVYGRYQFHESEVFAAGAELVLTLPTHTDFELTLGVPMRVYELFGFFTLDASVSFTLRAGDAFSERTSSPSDISFDIAFEGASTYNLTDQGFVQIGGGLRLANMNGGPGVKNVVELPFFLGGGYSYLSKKKAVLIDFFVQAGWLPLMFANRPDGIDAFNVADTWFVTFGARLFTRPLLGARR